MSQTQQNDSCQKHFEANGCLFFGVNRHVVTVPLESRKTVNSWWYTTICLSEIFEEIGKNNRQHRIILYHNNACCHTSVDLVPNDFYLFPSVKNKLRGQRFLNREEIVDGFKMHLLEKPNNQFNKTDFNNHVTFMDSHSRVQNTYYVAEYRLTRRSQPGGALLRTINRPPRAARAAVKAAVHHRQYPTAIRPRPARPLPHPLLTVYCSIILLHGLPSHRRTSCVGRLQTQRAHLVIEVFVESLVS
ncbi:hypothetical protein EVAR_39887_1 [Eumeta japonica]|uniref:Mariner Mos1 transposase n=1 Tax=Eumeta variegata TaxID=151549 RepID=A0A4C1WLZ1_EUMVA|nr:hypothetical protein EVAR_39887_1 [Eumeta japonica]